MHRTGVDNLGRLDETRIAFQRHAAPGTTVRGVSLHAVAHRAEVFLSKLTRLLDRDICDLIVTMLATAGMCGRSTFAVSFHPLNCTLLKVKCRAARTRVLANSWAKAAI
jgi:hypothetical protein